ncbi:hypothetical protein ACFU8I_38315 [Streptomyces sp. NPDC057540]|uniref:hypothetical protein n=1 Tax=Streptomyces sp. NPDC057540 TaxID=3346160 RepID=UPI0036C45766
MNLLTLLPFVLLGGAVFAGVAVSRSRFRVAAARGRREEDYRAALPRPTIALDSQTTLALEALDEMCTLSNSVPGVFVDMERYFAGRGWNRGDVFLLMGRLAALGLAQQFVTPDHPYSSPLYRATPDGVRENMANFGRKATAPNISVHQTTEQGDNTATVAVGSTVSAHQTRQGEVRNLYKELAQRLREDAARATQAEADTAVSNAGNLDAALAAGDTEAREAAMGRIHRFLLTAGSAFQASQHLLTLIGPQGS